MYFRVKNPSDFTTIGRFQAGRARLNRARTAPGPVPRERDSFLDHSRMRGDLMNAATTLLTVHRERW
jgi:hypothetical protein